MAVHYWHCQSFVNIVSRFHYYYFYYYLKQGLDYFR